MFVKKNETVIEHLRLEDIQITEESVICIFLEEDGTTPLRVCINEVFENANIFKSVSHEALVALRKVYEIIDRKKKLAKISAILGKNSYEITYNDQFKAKITGEALCSDHELLGRLDIKDAFKIIYNTAFNNAMTGYLNSDKKILD